MIDNKILKRFEKIALLRCLKVYLPGVVKGVENDADVRVVEVFVLVDNVAVDDVVLVERLVEEAVDDEIDVDAAVLVCDLTVVDGVGFEVVEEIGCDLVVVDELDCD